MEEQWKPVVGFEDCYEVSDCGSVRAITRYIAGPQGLRLIPGRPLKWRINKWRKTGETVRGVYVHLSRNGQPKSARVGRLVLEAFVGPAPPGTECCHWDGDSLHNTVGNLRWATHTENMDDIIRYGGRRGPRNQRKGEASCHTTLTDDDVRCIRAEPKFRGVNTMLATAFGIGYHAIHKIRSGKNWKHLQ